MNFENILQALLKFTEDPYVVVILALLGLLGFALYVVLQAIYSLRAPNQARKDDASETTE